MAAVMMPNGTMAASGMARKLSEETLLQEVTSNYTYSRCTCTIRLLWTYASFASLHSFPFFFFSFSLSRFEVQRATPWDTLGTRAAKGLSEDAQRSASEGSHVHHGRRQDLDLNTRFQRWASRCLPAGC